MSVFANNQDNKLTGAQLLRHPLMSLHSLPAMASRLLALALAGVVSLLLVSVLGSPLDTLEERLGALGWTMAPATVPEQRVTLVTIDERSISAVGPWPWTREQMARLVSAVNAAGAQLQLHDIVYPEARPGDAVMLAALQQAGNPVLAQVPVLSDNPANNSANSSANNGGQASSPNVTTGTMGFPLGGISCQSGTGPQLASTSQYLAPHAGFAAIPRGHITPIIAADGAIRKTPAVVCVDGQPYPALALTAFLAGFDSNRWQASIEPGESMLDAPFIMRLAAYPGLEIPLDQAGNIRISYARDPGVFNAISAIDVMDGSADLSALDNTWVLIGGTAFGMGDVVPTPYDGAAAGVELQARLLASLLDVAVPYTPAGSLLLLALVSLVFAAAIYSLATMEGRLGAFGLPAAAVVLPLVALAIHGQLLNEYNLWLGWLYPALYGLTAGALMLLLEQSRVRVERSRVFGNLNSYLPQDLAREIAYSLPSSSINARRTNVTLLSADLRNFSAFGETRPPEESAAVLHYFFTRATAIIEQHHGRVHEFKGDGVLAVWEGNGDAAEQALAAAQAMQDSLHTLIPEHALNGLEPLALGIGIEQGPVLLGSIGPAHRRTHTLLGDTVAITLRIQEMTAELAQPILLGECAARQLGNEQLESQGSYLLSGLRTLHVLFAPQPRQRERDPRDTDNGPGKGSQPRLKVVAGGRA
jgi:class 3 adenylate cyclase